MTIFGDPSKTALLRGKLLKRIIESALPHRKSLFWVFLHLFGAFLHLFESLWQWTKNTTEKTTQWVVSMKVRYLTANHFLGCNYIFLKLFYTFVVFLWQRRQITTEKTVWRKITTFSKWFAKHFTSNTTFLFRVVVLFFLGQFTKRTTFQWCTFYWNPVVEVPQNHDRKDVFF